MQPELKARPAQPVLKVPKEQPAHKVQPARQVVRVRKVSKDSRVAVPGPQAAGAAGAAGSTGARGPAGLAVGYSNLNQSFPDSPISTSNPSPSIIAKTATAPAGTYYLYAMTSILLNGGFGNEGIVPVVVCRFMTGSNTVQPANVANFQGAVGSGSTVSLVDVVTITSPDTFEYVCGAQATTSASSTQGAITALLINSSN